MSVATCCTSLRLVGVQATHKWCRDSGKSVHLAKSHLLRGWAPSMWCKRRLLSCRINRLNCRAVWFTVTAYILGNLLNSNLFADYTIEIRIDSCMTKSRAAQKKLLLFARQFFRRFNFLLPSTVAGFLKRKSDTTSWYLNWFLQIVSVAAHTGSRTDCCKRHFTVFAVMAK